MSEETNVTDVPEKAVPLQPADPVEMPAVMGATFAERAAARKAIEQAENKAVKSSESKSRRK